MKTQAPCPSLYQPRIESASQYLQVRQIRYHIRTWGKPQPDQPPIIMLHGWMDVSSSWQFIADELDALGCTRHIIAPDWRGFGYSSPQRGTETFFFPDYLADLECIIDTLTPAHAPDLVGHSMGGHICLLYGGVRPQRVRSITSLDGFGMPATNPQQAPHRLGKWLDMVQQERSGKLDLHPYPDLAGVVQRLQKSNPRLPDDKAHWLSSRWSQQGEDGKYRILGAPAHKVINPYLFRLDEALACYRSIQAPTLILKAAENRLHRWHDGSYTLEKFIERMQNIPDMRLQTIADAGHMLHHDQPAAIASQLLQHITIST